MKKVQIFIMFLAFLTLVISSSSQTIKLNLKEGWEYEYLISNRAWAEIQNGEENGLINTSGTTLVVKIEKVINNDSLLISVNQKNYVQKVENQNYSSIQTDALYPDFSPLTIVQSGSPHIANFLSRTKIIMSVDLKNRKIAVVNKYKIITAFRNWLKAKEFKDSKIDEILEEYKNSTIFDFEETVQFLLWFQNSKIGGKNRLENSLMEGDLFFSEKENGKFFFSTDESTKKSVGKTFKQVQVNAQTGLLSHYHAIKTDSLKQIKIGFPQELKHRIGVKESKIALVSSQNTKNKKVTILGSIEKPLDKMVNIRFLDSPFGTKMKDITFEMDNSNQLNSQIELNHGTFIWIDNIKRGNNPRVSWLFYAEPGDTIGFDATGEKLPWNVSFYGNRSQEANLLQELQELKLEPNKIPGKILEGELMYFMFRNDDGLYKDAEKQILNTYKQAEEIIIKYKDKLDSRSYQFISNELKNYFQTGIYNLLSNQRLIITENYSFANSNISFPELETIANNHSVESHYNDYGFNSRLCVTNFVRWKYNSINKSNPYNNSFGSFSRFSDVENYIQFARLVLGGSALYREICNAMQNSLYNNTLLSVSSHIQVKVEMAIRNLNLVSNICNDLEIVNKVNQLKYQYNLTNNEYYFPDRTFYDVNEKPVQLEKLILGKPSIIYFSDNWTGNRYKFDDMAKQNQDVNFIMILDGDNIKSWKRFTGWAEPVAINLFMFNDSASMRDLLFTRSLFFIFDAKGKLIGKVSGENDALKMAKSSLVPVKKELNKSQMQLIITLMGALILIISSIFLLWKWRYRQRLRIEQQQRRLRELELTAIRSQMNPHFLFNSLNSIQNLVQQNKGREALMYLSDFAGIIRKVLQNSEKEEISLAEEIEMTRQYLNLEKLRFDFDFSISVEEEIDANNTMVPSMLIQPFAENAIVHGLQNKPDTRNLEIKIERENSRSKIKKSLIIYIEDNGIGREAAAKFATGKNGKSTNLNRERLEKLKEKQGENYRLEITDLNQFGKTGTRVEIQIPEE